MLFRAQRTVHSIGQHIARAVHTGVKVAREIDQGVQKVGIPVYNAVKPLLAHRGFDTSGIDRGLKTYEGLRRAVG
jgi:hypothetical protein